MITDLTKSSAEQILTLVNETNLSALDFTHIEFGTPIALENDPDNCNVALDVISRPNGGYKGIVGVKYNRLDMEGFTQYGEPIIDIPVNGNLNDVITAFNEYYDANLSLEEDIDNTTTLPDIDYIGKPYVLTAKEESLAYQGTIELLVRYTSEELSDVIANGILSGLEYPYAFKGLIEQLPNISGYALSTTKLGAVVVGDKIYFTSGDSTFNLTSSYDPATGQTENVPSNSPQYPNSPARGIYDGVVYVLYFSNSSNGIRINFYKYLDPFSSSMVHEIFDYVPPISLPNYDGTVILAKQNNILYTLVGSNSTTIAKHILAIDIINYTVEVIVDNLSGATYQINSSYSDLASKSPIINNNLYFIVRNRVHRLNLTTRELVVFATLGSAANTYTGCRIIGLGNKIIVTNVTTKEILAYSEDGTHEVLGLTTDYGINSHVSMVNFNNEVYVFNYLGNRQVLKIS